MDAVHLLIKSLEAKDGPTAAHTWRVVLYTRALAERFGLDHSAIKRLSIAAALHDVGKLDVPDEILQKPGPLSPAEWVVMKSHTLWGEKKLRALGLDDPLVLELVRSHHERVDGSGYPDGLRGGEIPQSARVFAVIDSFDAMTSLRPYRTAAGIAAAPSAVEELERGRGSNYCHECVDAFVALYRAGELAWILEYFSDQGHAPAFALELAATARSSTAESGRPA